MPELGDLISDIKNGNLKYYNFYNTDLGAATYFAAKHYLDNPNDNIDNYDQKLHIAFFDIEVYKDDPTIRFDFSRSDFPINCITLYSTKENIYKSFYLLIDENRDLFNQLTLENHILDYKNQLLDHKYFDNINDINIEIKIYNKELDLISDFWKELKRIDPMILGGFNSKGFDIPYTYRRTLYHLNNKEDVDNLISRFGYVEFDGRNVKIPEYGDGDIQHFYKPRGEGGLNYGKTLTSYSLDNISDIELKLKKFEYKGSNKNLDDFYRKDPHNYLLYNIIDVILTDKLNTKLNHIGLHNLLRRMQYAPFTRSLVGNSALFDSYITYKLLKENKRVRHGMNSENAMQFNPEDFKDITIPKIQKGLILPTTISPQSYRSIVNKFDGAYVKDSKSKIINSGLIMDLDATSLYPSMILTSNIGFDTFVHRIIPPLTYNMINFLENNLGKTQLDQKISNKLFELVNNYVDKEEGLNKREKLVHTYYTINKLLKSLFDSGFPLSKIVNPTIDTHSILLTKYLIPFLDVFNSIHPNRKEYNNFAYDYMFDSKENLINKYPFLYVIKNVNTPNQTIDKMNLNDTIEFINNYSFTITGCCFIKHEEYQGLFTETLRNLKTMRNEAKHNMFKYPEGTDNYNYFNNKQLAIKVN
ncbi:MAG: hypothetical protein H7836_08170 [Magnetococcus sp. YQC-3]